MLKHVAPKFRLEAFTCPHCGAVAEQKWSDVQVPERHLRSMETPFYRTSFCMACKQYSIWLIFSDSSDRMVYPTGGTSPSPHPEMSGSVKDTYEQARSIAELSPCASAALLRKALEQLLMEYRPPKDGKKFYLNKTLESLKKDIPESVYMNLESVKLVGDKSIHPGEIDMEDFPEITTALFELVNEIFEKLVAQPNRHKKLHEKIDSITNQKREQ